MLIDDFTQNNLVSSLGTPWRGVSDRVMGGISEASVVRDVIDGRPCLRLCGEVRLENNGGFIQAALDLSASGDTLDASEYNGLRLVARGNGERYSVHLRTPDTVRPWQSYRAHFTAGPEWEVTNLPFAAFMPHRLDAALDIARLRRIGLVAIGRAFFADLAVCELGFCLQPALSSHSAAVSTAA
ncbi:MAG: CIA30 family protein [Alphaproteobacteria bacterium]|nr:CIA30 family protein [Alphaproteobacteria bacterium]